MNDRCLLLFTKPARPGQVKTRMIGRWTAEQAADLHSAFLDDVLATVRRGAFDVRVAWALDAGEAVPSTPSTGEHLRHERQIGADLGARLAHALADASQRYAYVAVVGSDHPELETATLEAAFDRLAGPEPSDIVLGPAADGGYFLIALRAAAVDPRLFDGIAWSTERVLQQTLARAGQLGLRVDQLPVGHDVDDAAALEALAARLGVPGSPPCPRTRALLGRWGVLPAATSDPEGTP